MNTYITKFIANITDTMRQSRKNQILFGKKISADFMKLREFLSKIPILRYYDVNKDSALSVVVMDLKLCYCKIIY